MDDLTKEEQAWLARFVRKQMAHEEMMKHCDCWESRRTGAVSWVCPVHGQQSTIRGSVPCGSVSSGPILSLADALKYKGII